MTLEYQTISYYLFISSFTNILKLFFQIIILFHKVPEIYPANPCRFEYLARALILTRIEFEDWPENLALVSLCFEEAVSCLSKWRIPPQTHFNVKKNLNIKIIEHCKINYNLLTCFYKLKDVGGSRGGKLRMGIAPW